MHHENDSKNHITHLDVPVCQGRAGLVQLPHGETHGPEEGHQRGLGQRGGGQPPPLQLVV